ncbi:helix-turn-helix domain-containing protein [Streptomyces sp. NBC_01619]|nr:helix-turn-helix domain-containing protein [Streptomyces sp. NBC_01619]
MRLRCGFRLYPNGPQRVALAKAFGCARVTVAHAAGLAVSARGARVVRREAHVVRVEVQDHHRRPVAAGRLKLRAA